MKEETFDEEQENENAMVDPYYFLTLVVYMKYYSLNAQILCCI